MATDKTTAKESFLPCPLCHSDNLRIETYGVECQNCGVWYGNGSKSMDRGGVKSWNIRIEEKFHGHTAKEWMKALVGVLEGNSSWYEIRERTGLPEERCKEISKMFNDAQ